MGKSSTYQQLPVVHSSSNGGASRIFFCERCSLAIRRHFSVKCCVVLMLSFAVFLFAFFSVVRVGYREPGFDAKDSIKLSAIVQVYFKIQRQVTELLQYISRLEYDVNDEIGVPFMKVAVLSMHQTHSSNGTSLSNWTDVVLGFIPDTNDSAMNSVALSVLKSSLVDVFLQQYNLTLTTSIFRQPSSFEILRFPGGITIMPERSAFVVEPLFTFVLNSSIYDITQKLPELKTQLKWGIHLLPDEVIYVKLTNNNGSTVAPPVTVEASVASNLGTPLPERLKQLVQIITNSTPGENLGLEHSVFGKVKQISLSSFLNRSLQAPPPSLTPSPAPSPNSGHIYNTHPPYVPSYAPTFSSSSPCSDCYSSDPSRPSQASSPSLSNIPYHHRSLPPNSNCGSTDPPSPSPSFFSDHITPNLSPLSSSTTPVESPSRHIQPDQREKRGQNFMSPIHASSSFPSAYLCTWRSFLLYSVELMMSLLFLYI